jgi:hypothetical protein
MLAKVHRDLTPEQTASIARIDAEQASERARVESVIRNGAPKIEALVTPLPAAPSEPMSRKQAKAFRARLKRAQEKQRAIMIAAQNAAREEAEAEAIAPSVRRTAVTDPQGNVVRGPLLERDGITFARVNVVRRLHKVSPKLITEKHVMAVERLIRTHEEVAGGIGLGGSSDYLSKSASGGSWASGISEAKQSALLSQCTMRAELEGVLAWLGGSVMILAAVAFDCLSVTTWAEQQGIDYRVAMGQLVSGLDRLVEFYSPEKSLGPSRIRAADFVGPSPN